MGQKAETFGVMSETRGISDAKIISLAPYAAARQRQAESPSRARALHQLTKYAFHKARLGPQHSENPEFAKITRLLWAAKAVICPEAVVDYLEPEYGEHDLVSSEYARVTLSKMVNPTTVNVIAQTDDVLPWLQELSSFVTNPDTFVPAAPEPEQSAQRPVLRLVQ